MNTDGAHPFRWHRGVLLLVCLAALLLRVQGINWPSFNPDEVPIGHCVNNAANGASLKDKLYAYGFFHLVRPMLWVSHGIDFTLKTLAYQRGLKDRIDRTGDDAILVARWFNVWASMLVCLTGYLLVRRITCSPWAGVFGAALLGLAQYPVEHSHYGETDIAMLLALTTTLWLIAVTAESRRKFVFVLAALAGGFASGTKFTLVSLLPIILALGVTFDPRPLSLRAYARAAGMACIGLVFFLLGFLLAIPEAADVGWFTTGLAYEKARVFHETALNMGPLRGDPHIRHMVHAREFLAFLTTLGWGWLVLAAVGLLCLAFRPFRRFWTVTLLFPVLFLFYWIYQAPWVRSQEFMVFLPGFAVLAALPLVVLWQSGRSMPRLAVFILAAIALAVNGINGCRTASLFKWTDTRLLTKQWMQTHMPMHRTVATEHYADPAWVDVGNVPVCIDKVERDGLAYLLKQKTDYLLRSASESGRGLRHPLTGDLYAAPQALFDEFLRHSERLCAWAPLPPQGLATFVSPAIELYGLKKFSPSHTINLELSRPLWVNNYYVPERGRQTFFPVGHALGAAAGLLIDCQPRAIGIGGPENPQGPVYLVVNTAERTATVHIRGFGQTRRTKLSPYDAAIVTLERSPWRPRLSQFEEITLRTERVKHVLFVPCFVRVAFSPAEAVRACLDLGAEEAVWKTFSEQEIIRACDPVTAYLLAVRSGRWAMASRLEAAADRVAAALTTIAGVDPAAVRINGHSGYYVDEFARVRMDEAPQNRVILREDADARWIVKKTTTENSLDLTEPVHSASPPRYEAVLQLPVRLARGRYTFYGDVMAEVDPPNAAPEAIRADKPAGETLATVFEFHFGQPDQCLARHAADQPGAWKPLAFDFQVAREIQPRIVVRAPSPARLYFRNTEISWSLASMLAAARDELAAARAAHAMAAGKYDDARQCLSAFGQEPFRWNELEIRQLDLACRRSLDDREGTLRAAHQLLELAPGNYAALQALGEAAPAFQAEAARLDANLKTPVAFGASMSLVGFSMDPGGRLVRCVWEAGKNETPPMAATFWIHRHGEWRKKQSQCLSSRPWLAKGERVAMEVTLNEALAGYTPDTMGLGLETAVQWHPGALPVAGTLKPVVSFADVNRMK